MLAGVVILVLFGLWGEPSRVTRIFSLGLTELSH